MFILIFIISLAVLVLVHEFGHFIVAKISGIRVDEFGLGFPPRIFGKKFGETTYTLNALPFGGFVRIFGEDAHGEQIAESEKPVSFVYKSKWIQAAVLVAGVSMNIIFAWLLISAGFMVGLPTPVDAGLGSVSNPHLVITEVLPGSPAEKAGLEVGDSILRITSDNTVLENSNVTPQNLQNLTKFSKGSVNITYSRGNSSPTTISMTPEIIAGSGDPGPTERMIGVGTDIIGTLKLPLFSALWQGAQTTGYLTKGTVLGLGAFLYHVVTFHADFSQISGPVGIAGTFGQTQALGFVYTLSLIALISINLAVINLLPFPALDGGRLLFVAIEAIIRRPVSPKVVHYANTVGLILLLCLMLLVTGHDVLKLLST